MLKRLMVIACLSLLSFSATAVASPEFVLMGDPVDVGGGEYRFDYTLTNYSSPSPVYDLEFEYSIAAAWIRVYGPDEWVSYWEGPLWCWSTETAPCTVDSELGGFHIYAGGPAYSMSPMTFTDQGHAVFCSGSALLPVPEPGSLLALGAGVLSLAGIVRRRP